MGFTGNIEKRKGFWSRNYENLRYFTEQLENELLRNWMGEYKEDKEIIITDILPVLQQVLILMLEQNIKALNEFLENLKSCNNIPTDKVNKKLSELWENEGDNNI